MPELVSVVVPTYNRAYCLSKTLNSVLQQTYKSLELIVIDDGSIDDTEALIASEYANEPRVQYLYQENQGVAAARNRGLRASHGEYVAFLDSDDIWKPWKIELQLSVFKLYPEVGMVWTDMEAINPEGEVISERYLRTMYSAYKWFSYDNLFSHAYPIEQISPVSTDIATKKMLYVGNIFSQMLMGSLVHTSTVVICRDRLEKVKNFDERLQPIGEDYDFHLRTCREGMVAYLDVPSIQYRVGSMDQLTHSSHDIQLAQNNLRTIESVIKTDKDIIDLPEWMINQTLADANSWLGQTLFDNANFIHARKNFLKSLKYKRKQPRLWLFLSLSFIPCKVVEKGRFFYRNLKKFSCR